MHVGTGGALLGIALRRSPLVGAWRVAGRQLNCQALPCVSTATGSTAVGLSNRRLNSTASVPGLGTSSSSSSSSPPPTTTKRREAAATGQQSNAAVDRNGEKGALEVAQEAGLPALPPSGVGGITYKGPVEEDLTGGARVSSTAGAMWSNIPNHIRASFQAPQSLDDAPKPSGAPDHIESLTSKAKALVATTGFAPASWSQSSCEAAMYYGGQISLEPYKKGQTAAYHYPRILVPREVAHRFPVEMYVSPVYQTSDVANAWRMKPSTLFPRLQGKTTLLLIFSGQPLSGLWTGVRHWLDNVGKEFVNLPKTQVFKMHCEKGWFNRRTHQLTKFHLRRQVQDEELFTTFVYHGKWKWEYVQKLHLYNNELPVVVLMDSLGYVRWHAVGLPSDDATAVFKALAHKLAHEKRNFA